MARTEPRRTVTGWAANKARQKIREHTHPFSCDLCNKRYRVARRLNAHHGAKHVQRWTSAKSKKVARALGKDVEQMRSWMRSGWESYGLADRGGKLTARARSRPRPKPGRHGRTGLSQMRKLHRHDRDHEKAIRHERTAGKTRIPGRKDRLLRKAKARRARWPERTAPAARPAPARTAPASANGVGMRPAPSRPARTVPARTAPSGSRLAPSRSGRSTR